MSIKNIAVVGVGLIGGSFSLGLKRNKYPAKITGFGRNRRKLIWALTEGIIDDYSLDWRKIKEADVVLLALPVDLIVPALKKISLFLGDKTIVTDVGSVKKFILAGVKKISRGNFFFVGGHPLAGAEKSGAKFAQPNLFEGACVVLTPEVNTNRTSLSTVKELWQVLGAQVIEMPASEHDRIVALTSHLPHLMAAALIRLTSGCQQRNKMTKHLIAGSFKDLTRVAASSPEIWTGICSANRRQIIVNLENLQKELAFWRKLLENKQWKKLKKEFSLVQRWRKSYVQNDFKKN